MLELEKILRDIDNLGKEQASTYKGIQDELDTAFETIHKIDGDLNAAKARIETAKTSWLTANFNSSPGTVVHLPAKPSSYAALASDGSQIMPDRNEAVLCYLINTASIAIYYGCGISPVANTTPTLYYRDEDLWENDYGGQKVRMNEKLISIKRMVSEMNVLEVAIQKAAELRVPTVALWDGSLIFWTIQDEPEGYRARVLSELMRAFDLAEDLGVPIVGYISNPGSKDFVNSLRIMLCDQTPVDCDKCIHKADSTDLPCEKMAVLKDSVVFKHQLHDGDRSVTMTSDSKILRLYGNHDIRVFYLHVGAEIARIEVPAWVANDEALLNLVHAVCYDQSQKGRGYPVALAEAHEHAVVHSHERATFYELVELSLIKHGAQITRSAKRLAKNY